MKDWDELDKPREKLIHFGRRHLSETELISILIGSGSRDENVVELARKIWSSANQDLNVLAKFNLNDFNEFKGMGQAKAVRIMAALELGRRRKEQKPAERPVLDSSYKVYQYLKHVYMDLSHEESWALYIDGGSRLIRRELIGKGGANYTPIDVKVVLWHALDCKASHIILSHNHPSDNLKASKADIFLTDKIITAAEYFDITILDHVIFGNHGFLSFKDEGLID